MFANSRGNTIFKDTTIRLIALDVHYTTDSALAAGIVFPTWESAQPSEQYVLKIEKVAAYQPGSFYLRELPCLEKVLSTIGKPITAIVIDGYVTLGQEKRTGLGAHLWRSLGEKIPVIGVAKSFFKGTLAETEVFRGESKKPLFVSSLGVPLEEAKQYIQRMHGAHRIPTLVKEVDRLSRSTNK